MSGPNPPRFAGPDEPDLDRPLTARQTPILLVVNAISPRMPLSTWRSPRLVRTREVMAQRAFGLGQIRMSGTMPSGQEGILMPERMYFIDEAAAVLDGINLGAVTRVKPNPDIGGIPLPARGVLAIGQGAWQTPHNKGAQHD